MGTPDWGIFVGRGPSSRLPARVNPTVARTGGFQNPSPRTGPHGSIQRWTHTEVIEAQATPTIRSSAGPSPGQSSRGPYRGFSKPESRVHTEVIEAQATPTFRSSVGPPPDQANGGPYRVFETQSPQGPARVNPAVDPIAMLSKLKLPARFNPQSSLPHSPFRPGPTHRVTRSLPNRIHFDHFAFTTLRATRPSASILFERPNLLITAALAGRAPVGPRTVVYLGSTVSEPSK